MILDFFAGPGGWSEGLRLLDPEAHSSEIGVEWDKAACLTRKAAGHLTVRADVARFVLEPLIGKVLGAILSPPCQAWSSAGKGLGLLDQPSIFAHVDKVEAEGAWLPYPLDGWHDPRSPLVLEVLRVILTVRPTWFACEQVPEVLPFWERCADLLAQHGYHVATFLLSAERYGVPQTRQRAFLTGHTDQPVAAPVPTHRRYVKGLPAGGRWGDHKGGMEGMFGDGLQPWVSMSDALGWGLPERPEFVTQRTSFMRSAKWMVGAGSVAGRSAAFAWLLPNSAVRKITEPDPTITGAHDSAERRWVEAAPEWTSERPSTTVVGSFRPNLIAAPGWRTDISRQDAPESVRVTVQQAAILQSFPPDYPWQGSKTAQHRQVGDAVPPLLAMHVLAATTGWPLPTETA